ncbi:GNAT family N-acetyltransferase [Kitasatospora sp. NPDC093806]|uniref:GNAT family N-acetyltransferase n=1 Tax=Kitasatospora sp. NPDC093806 TaxID=3155075 RepID=UPI00343DAF38
MISLRVLTPADPADWPLWRDARLAALAEAPYAFKRGLADWQSGGEALWRARFAQSDALHVVAVLPDGRPVGLASGVPVPDGRPADGAEGGAAGGPAGGTVSELRSVWVGPEARGRGVGDRLIAAVEAWARRSGSGALRLAVLPGNAAAVALYRRNGFADADEPGEPGKPGEPLAGGMTREHVMVKQLTGVDGVAGP